MKGLVSFLQRAIDWWRGIQLQRPSLWLPSHLKVSSMQLPASIAIEVRGGANDTTPLFALRKLYDSIKVVYTPYPDSICDAA